MKTKTKLFSIAFLLIFSLAGCMKTPMACFTIPTTGTVGQPVTCNSSCCMNASKFEWDFGDGSTKSTDANTTHIYTAAGTFTMKLMAMSSDGKKMDNTSKTITIN